MSEVHQNFGEFASQTIRLHKGADYAEIEHTIGPIPVDDNEGKEIITRFKTNIQNNGVFYTDANGREMKRRKRNHQETFQLNNSEPVSGNYYPITSLIFIEDKGYRLSVMTDRAQGGGSIRDGEMELMLHRRLLKDDILGVEEPLNEKGINGTGLVTRGIHKLFLTRPKESAQMHRFEGERMMFRPITSFMEANNPAKQLTKLEYTALNSSKLPENVHILTLELLGDTSILLRLEHFFEKKEHQNYSQTEYFNLDGLFSDFGIVSLIEMNLSADQNIIDKHQLKWNSAKRTGLGNHSRMNNIHIVSPPHYNVKLLPMEIRTFIITVKFNV